MNSKSTISSWPANHSSTGGCGLCRVVVLVGGTATGLYCGDIEEEGDGEEDRGINGLEELEAKRVERYFVRPQEVDGSRDWGRLCLVEVVCSYPSW